MSEAAYPKAACCIMEVPSMIGRERSGHGQDPRLRGASSPSRIHWPPAVGSLEGDRGPTCMASVISELAANNVNPARQARLGWGRAMGWGCGGLHTMPGWPGGAFLTEILWSKRFGAQGGWPMGVGARGRSKRACRMTGTAQPPWTEAKEKRFSVLPWIETLPTPPLTDYSVGRSENC